MSSIQGLHSIHLYIHVLIFDVVLEAADKTLAALRQARTSHMHPTRKRKIKEEVNSLFKQTKKKGKGNVWKHRFVCLATRDQERIPTTDVEKDDLLKAGLGEKVIEFDDLDMDTYSYRETILDAFPKLRDGGGFMFYKCTVNSRALEPLSQVVLSSPKMLKERVGTTRTYIRPVQKDLDISVVFELPEGVCV